MYSAREKWLNKYALNSMISSLPKGKSTTFSLPDPWSNSKKFLQWNYKLLKT